MAEAGAGEPGGAKESRLRARLRGLGVLLYGTLLTTLGGYCLATVLKLTGVVHVDALSWRLLAAVAVPLASGGSGGSGEQPIAVVMIGDRYFEREFQQSSPLNRNELAHVVAQIEAGVATVDAPVVAIDFDLSPAAQPDAAQRQAQAALDAALLSLARRATVVLLCPFAATEGLREAQLGWARALAAQVDPGRIVFVRPDLLVQAGAVLNYAADSPTLGHVAGDAALGGPRGAGGARPAPLQACMQAVPPSPKLAKINFSGYHAYRSIEIERATPLAALLQTEPPRLVFLGGSYALAADEFSSAAGERLRGVEMHAAVAYSRIAPVGPVPALIDPLLQYSVVLLVALAAKRSARWVFAHMRAPAAIGATGATAGTGTPLPWWRWLWGAEGFERVTYEAQAWTRWLVGLVLLLGVFLVFLVGFGAISLALMLLLGYWYDFLFMALVAFGKTCSVELRRLLDQLSQPGESALPAAAASPDRLAPFVLPFGIVLRSVVLLVGAGVLVGKLLALTGG